MVRRLASNDVFASLSLPLSLSRTHALTLIFGFCPPLPVPTPRVPLRFSPRALFRRFSRPVDRASSVRPPSPSPSRRRLSVSRALGARGPCRPRARLPAAVSPLACEAHRPPPLPSDFFPPSPSQPAWRRVTSPHEMPEGWGRRIAGRERRGSGAMRQRTRTGSCWAARVQGRAPAKRFLALSGLSQAVERGATSKAREKRGGESRNWSERVSREGEPGRKGRRERAGGKESWEGKGGANGRGGRGREKGGSGEKANERANFPFLPRLGSLHSACCASFLRFHS